LLSESKDVLGENETLGDAEATAMSASRNLRPPIAQELFIEWRLNHMGTWCNGIAPVQHTGGLGFNPQRVRVGCGWSGELGNASRSSDPVVGAMQGVIMYASFYGGHEPL
jgi:hypothetical protein